ncbi:hypothetical protein ALUC_30506A [Aspergillus luchuensis]|nr:hypothetical protein ALUC_30506A [Aspergillus luchuensis]
MNPDEELQLLFQFDYRRGLVVGPVAFGYFLLVSFTSHHARTDDTSDGDEKNKKQKRLTSQSEWVGDDSGILSEIKNWRGPAELQYLQNTKSRDDPSPASCSLLASLLCPDRQTLMISSKSSHAVGMVFSIYPTDQKNQPASPNPMRASRFNRGIERIIDFLHTNGPERDKVWSRIE